MLSEAAAEDPDMARAYRYHHRRSRAQPTSTSSPRDICGMREALATSAFASALVRGMSGRKPAMDCKTVGLCAAKAADVGGPPQPPRAGRELPGLRPAVNL